MRALLLLLLLLPSIIAVAQSELMDVETFWIHKVDPNSEEEDIESYFPIVTGGMRPVTDAINMSLQMEILGKVLNDKTKAEFTTPVENPLARENLMFSFKRLSSRLIYFDIGSFRTNNAMSLNGRYVIKRIYFDVTTGIRVHIRDFFTPQGLTTLSQQAAISFRKNFMESMKVYQSGFSEKDIPKLNEDCECDCIAYVNSAFCGQSLLFDYDKTSNSFAFFIDDCDWMNPRQHVMYAAPFRAAQVAPHLSDYGKYLINDGPYFKNNTLMTLWKGTIGKIPIHFLLNTPDGCAVNEKEGDGSEIYDKYGVCIPLSWKITNNGGTTITIQELDGQNKPVAKISATLKDGKLTGTWAKADGSKTLPFEAVK